MTLLETFNNYLDRIYMEPDRKGVEKGKEIGVFRSTHFALLYSLYNFDEKEKAKRAGISYVFLRKLRCTDRFKEHVFHRRLNFVEECVATYLENGCFYTYVPTASTELRKIKVDHKTAFADAALYDDETKKLISEWLPVPLIKDDPKKYAEKLDRILNLLMNWNAPELNKEFLKKMVSAYSEEICKTLGNSKATDKEREYAIEYTKTILKVSSII